MQCFEKNSSSVLIMYRPYYIFIARRYNRQINHIYLLFINTDVLRVIIDL